MLELSRVAADVTGHDVPHEIQLHSLFRHAVNRNAI